MQVSNPRHIAAHCRLPDKDQRITHNNAPSAFHFPAPIIHALS